MQCRVPIHGFHFCHLARDLLSVHKITESIFLSMAGLQAILIIWNIKILNTYQQLLYHFLILEQVNLATNYAAAGFDILLSHFVIFSRQSLSRQENKVAY